MLSRARRSLAWATVVVLAACSSSTEPSGTSLTSAEARRAAGAFASIAAGSPAAFTELDSATVACPNGGSVRTSLSNQNTSGPIRAAVVFASCAVADSAGQLWTFTSLPRLDMSITTAIADTSVTSTSTTTGTLRVQSATVNGTCGINTRLEAVIRLRAPGGARIRQTGQVCGQVIDTTFTVTAPL